jgi:hypothetical protein
VCQKSQGAKEIGTLIYNDKDLKNPVKDADILA